MCRPAALLEYGLVRTRSALLILALTTLLLASGAAPSAALSERAATARAVPGKAIAAPALDAIVKRLPVRVAVRLPANATTLRVRVGRRNVSGHFGGSGSLRVAHLSLRNGLRYGQNELKVLIERRSGRPVIHARSFNVVRHRPQLAQVRVKPGPVTLVNVRVAGAGRLATIRRTRFARLWVNGRPAHRAVDHSLVTRYTAKLSATHGLRYGVNRVRVMVIEPDAGGYVEVRRRFRIKRNRHLAAAGWDVDTRAGRFVQLDGRRSRTADGGKARHSWRIVRKPRGSRATLRRAGTARPSITPDRPGHYVFRLTLSERSQRAGASQTSSTDSVGGDVAPARPLLPFKGLTRENNQNGILVGDHFYANPSPNGAAMQWLTLNRATLDPTSATNNWLDGSGSGAHGIPQLTAALKNQGTNQLVIFSFPYGSSAPPVQANQMNAFNAAMQYLGVSKIPSGILGDRNKLVIVGIPKAGGGTGWYTHGGGPVDAMNGWLMTDQVAGYRFQPDRPKFDTQASHTGTANTMNLAGQQFTAALPPGATGGFQVQFLDPIDFKPVAQDVFATNGVADPIAGINAMTNYLKNGQWGPHLVVQSIGTVAPPAPPSDPYQPDRGLGAWINLGQALAPFGANPHTFLGVNRAYAFFGGVRLARSEVAQSSTGVVTDPTKQPNTTQAGTLTGRLSMRSDGYVVPAAADPHDKLSYELYDIAFQTPQAWPYTKEAGEPHYADYTAAMTYITQSLDTTKNRWGNDLRVIYAADLNRDWTTERDDLAILPYPADQLPCSQPRGRDKQPDPGFTKEQYCTLVGQLRNEMADLKSVKTLFDAYKDTLNQSGAEGQVDLRSIGRQIHDDVAASNDDLAADIGEFFLMLAEILGLFVGITEAGAPILLAVVEALAATYQLSMSLTAQERSGVPLSDQVDTKVDQLAADVAGRLTRTAASLDSLREVIASDYGRLDKLGTDATTPEWVVKTDQLQEFLTTGANGYFTTELMPVAYNAWYLSPTFSWDDIKPDSCFLWGYGHSWKDSDVTNWYLNWQVPFAGQSGRGGSLLALGKKTWTWKQYAYPPDTLTTAFDPLTQGGDGVSLADFIWEKYKAPYSWVPCYT
jgi:hypothetical protein